MCAVPRENGAFRDSAHQHTLIYFIPSTQLHTPINTSNCVFNSFNTAICTQQLNTSYCVFKVCTVVQLHAALAIYS